MEKRLRDAPNPPSITFGIQSSADGLKIAPAGPVALRAYVDWLRENGASITPSPE